MAFAPMVPPKPEVSARAQDLARRLKSEVDKFEAQYPGTSQREVSVAARLAVGEVGQASPAGRRLKSVFRLVIVAQMVSGAVFIAAAIYRKDLLRPLLPIVLTVTVVGTALVFAAAIRHRRRSR